jgi:hypothetical protein
MLAQHIVSVRNCFFFLILMALSGLACGNERAIPPWISFIEDPDKYFGSDQVPDGFKLMDPSKMKDTQIKEILTFWYSKQECDGFGFKLYRDEKLNGRKRSRDDSDADTDSDADPDDRTPSRPRTKQSGSKGKGKGKGKGKMVEKPEERWTDHIVPDSRRSKRRALRSSEDEESGEVFDFTSVDQMESSEEEDSSQPQQPKAGPSKRKMRPVSKQQKLVLAKELTGKSTMRPLSKQSDRGLDTGKMVSTGKNGYLFQVGDQQEPEMMREGKAMKSTLAQKLQEPPKKKARFSIDIPAHPQSTGKWSILFPS